MNNAETKTIGVVGGMGPLATANFFDLLVRKMPFPSDQDHPRILIDSNPRVPDRTRAILEGGPSPAPVIRAIARGLQDAGADFLAMPCVTAHHFFDAFTEGIRIPFIHMIRETAGVYRKLYAGKKAGLLSTSGTQRAEIFQSAFPDHAILLPDESVQTECVMPAIYGVKGGDFQKAEERILKAADHLLERGADILIAGCTEVPLILRPDNTPAPVLDPVVVLADACIARLQAL